MRSHHQRRTAALAGVAALLAPLADARVVGSDPGGFALESSRELLIERARAFEIALRDISSWWDGSHTYSGDARNLSIEARPGGCFCERMPPDASIEHMRVVYVQPGSVIRFSGGLGPLQEIGATGALTWSFESLADGLTRIRWRYQVHGYDPQGMDRYAPVVDQVLQQQMDRLARHLGMPAPAPSGAP